MINMDIDPVALRAWADRQASIGRVLRPGEDYPEIGEILPHGYANGDCIEISFAGPLRIEAVSQEAFFAGEYAQLDARIVDTYYSVEPVGWEAPGRSMWIFGPSYEREGSGSCISLMRPQS